MAARRGDARAPRPVIPGARRAAGDALERAGTGVCEPVLRVRLEVPGVSTGAVLGALSRLGASGQTPSSESSRTVVEAELPADRVQSLQRQLPALTAGEGLLESTFAGYRPVAGKRPVRSS